MVGSKLWLVWQWAAKAQKSPNCRTGTRRVQCKGESAVRSGLQGSTENWRPNLRHFLRTRSTTTRDRNPQFRGAVSTEFFGIFSSGCFHFLQVFFGVKIGKEIARKRGENCPISRRRKSRRILSRLWLSWFFRSRFSDILYFAPFVYSV